MCHYQKPDFCRVCHNLPCASPRAHNKQEFCRVCSRKHTAKLKHTASFAVCFFLAHDKEILCRVLFCDTRQSTRQIYYFAVCFILAHDKVIIFLSFQLETFSTLHIQYVVLHIKIWKFFYIYLLYLTN